MSATRATRSSNTVRTHPVTLRRVILSEWVKFRTLRSTWAVLGAAVVGMFVLALIIASNTRHITPDIDPNDLSQSATMQGYYLGQLLLGALGVLYVSSEFSTGMVRATFAAVPSRLPVLWAKLVVFVCVVAVTMVATCVVAFVASQTLIVQSRPAYSLGDPHVLRVVIGTGLYLTIVGVIGGALGWIVRSTPGALVSYFALMLLVPVLCETVLGTWGKDIGRYLPSVAGGSFIALPLEPDTLTALPGLLVLLIWTVGLVAVAALTLRRRDA